MSGDSPFPLFGDVTAPSDKASLAAETTWAAYLRADDAVVERPPSSDVGGGGIGRGGAADVVGPETRDAGCCWQKFFWPGYCTMFVRLWGCCAWC